MEKKFYKQDDIVNEDMNKNIRQIRKKSRVSVVDLFRKSKFQRKLGRVSFFIFSSFLNLFIAIDYFCKKAISEIFDKF